MESRKPPPSALVDNHVVPGDVVLDLAEMTNQTIKLGAGLRQDCDTIQATSAGRLRLSKPSKYWVESSQKRYIPSVEDTVLGVVVDTKPDNFLVDIKGPNLAFLPVLAFEGGTRRNIPKFEIGTLIYARVVKANSIMNPELSCMDATGKAAEFGQLKDGYMFDTSTGLSRMLLSSPTCPILEALGKKLSFEIAVGLNGRVWVEVWCQDLAMGGRRVEINANKCGTHPTPSKPYYVDKIDTNEQKVVHYQVNCRPARDRNTGSYSVKHHYPSPIVSWIEDLSSFGNVSFSQDPEYADEQSRSSVGQSSASVNLHDMQISVRLTDEFIELAKENTGNNVETCGILGASFRDGTYYVTMLIIPKQEATAHSCQAVSEEEIHAILSEQSLYPAGWIHTHPSQTCFLSSIDLHTQYSYQVMLPEAVAIVIAPTDPTRNCGIFRLTDPGGMGVLRECSESGFHAHRETTDGGPIYETCSKVIFNPNLRFEIVDLRSAP
ncbi:hypothetical protein OsJ_02901 [Oryza sativa Japonica Group]|uniref:Ribosomal RNA-processing protein 40 n=2 Tax=Oryza sativa subsp. japonica TaxID=39947 RepID=B9EYG0_ORYSJ|nr:hypothetical protein OsJ_02901 [Oryza sativa Japonica Group]